jgi:hypothetical protein
VLTGMESKLTHIAQNADQGNRARIMLTAFFRKLEIYLRFFCVDLRRFFPAFSVSPWWIM